MNVIFVINNKIQQIGRKKTKKKQSEKKKHIYKILNLTVTKMKQKYV